MTRSFRARLLVPMVAVVLTSALGVALLSRQLTHTELRRVRAHESSQLRDAVVTAYAQRGSWADARAALERLAVDERTLVVDAAGRVVIAPLSELQSAHGERQADGSWRVDVGGRELALRGGEPIEANGQVIGTLLVLPAALDEPSEEQRIDRWLIWIVVGVGLAGVALTFVIARSIARPIETVTETVGRVTAGDRSARAQVTSGGEIGVLAASFNSLLDALDKQEQLRRTMVSDVAHELRAPLANLRYQIEAMQDGVLAADSATLAAVLDDTLALGRLVDDLQDLALADAGQLRIDLGAVDLASELRRAVQSIEPAARAAGVTVELHVDDDVRVLADPRRLAQVTRNLLDNALAHTPPAGTIRIALPRPAGDEVEVRVTDTGEGIAAEHLANVFERFYRVDPSRARATGGAGLGLSIAKQLVEAQGGRIWVESVVGRGASFVFTLRTRS
ncbi:MAG: HAMP domain-containing protein [Deltaproteobacteria bacterium]|nr:HAMP domain-containing protein [Deltaproteobacteria bacterium]